MLFDPNVEMSRLAKAPDESTWEFIERSEGSFWRRVRAQLEVWISVYPDSDRTRLVADLKSRRFKQHSGAYWELYLFHLIGAHGGDATCHPTVPDSRNPPDFLVEGLAGGPFYLEAKYLGEQTDFAAQSRQAQLIMREINDRVKSRIFRVFVDIETEGHRPISMAKASRAVKSWLAAQEVDIAHRHAPRLESRHHPDSYIWESSASGWKLRFTATLKDNPDATDQVMGAGPGYGGMVTDYADLRDAIMDNTPDMATSWESH